MVPTLTCDPSPSQILYPVHRNLLEGLERCREVKLDSGRADVTQHFLTQHSGFLYYGQYAVRLPSAIERVSEQGVVIRACV